MEKNYDLPDALTLEVRELVQKVDSINEMAPVLSDLTSCNWSACISYKSDQNAALY